MPEDLIHANKRREVLKWLLVQPFSGSWKSDVLRGWGAETGVKLTVEEYRLVRGAGFDVTPVDVPREGA